MPGVCTGHVGPKEDRTADFIEVSLRARYGRIVIVLITGAVSGRLMPPSDPMVVGVLASASTMSMPAVTPGEDHRPGS